MQPSNWIISPGFGVKGVKHPQIGQTAKTKKSNNKALFIAPFLLAYLEKYCAKINSGIHSCRHEHPESFCGVVACSLRDRFAVPILKRYLGKYTPYRFLPITSIEYRTMAIAGVPL